MMNSLRSTVVACIAALFLSVPATAYECDQYWNRLTQIEDSADLINQKFRQALQTVAEEWRGPENRRQFSTAVYQSLGSRHWVDPVERWAMTDPQFDHLPQSRSETIYAEIPFWARRVSYFTGIGPTIRIGGDLIGTDKLGHFVSQGWKYYRRHLRDLPLERVVKLGNRNENGYFGALFTGIFSNADLVANYEGFLFYRSLFEDNVVGELPAIIVFEEGRARVQRDFDFANHVNEFWDEALNPNHFSPFVRRNIVERLKTLCDDYFSSPGSYIPQFEDQLLKRYQALNMETDFDLRLARVCEPDMSATISPADPS